MRKILLLTTIVMMSSALAYSAIPEYEKIKENSHSIELARQLRKAIITDPQLSSNAHNIEIISVENAIILKGHVNSRAEKVKIENLARARAGHDKVYNRLTY